MKKEFATLTVVFLLLLAMVAPLLINKTAKADVGDAWLTGNVHDYGEDTDSDGLYNYLVVEVEANVTVAGTYTLQVSRLAGEPKYEYVLLSTSNQTYLETGIQNITLSFNGIAVHGSRINVTKLIDIYFYDSAWNVLGIYSELNLTMTYEYTLFDVGATFTGTIIDSGVDTDGNGLYDYLDLGIEIDVKDAGLYYIYAYNLANASDYVSIYSYCRAQVYLSQGTYYMNFSIYGPTIYSSYVTNISTVNNLYLELVEQTFYRIDFRDSLPLSKTYDYTDFEFHAQLTGKITDEGVDTDGNGLFNYLRVGVEINVTEAGYYGIVIVELVDNETNYLEIANRAENYFGLGNHTIYLDYYGQMFAYYHFSPLNLSHVHLYEVDPNVDLGEIESAMLSRTYDYTFFDAPSKDMQIYFTAYPNGTLGVEGQLNFTHMYPQRTGPAINASIDISTTGSMTEGVFSGSLAFPSDGMFEWPFNSIVANLTSKYEGGLVNSTLDLTMFMPPGPGRSYPFNSTEFELVSLYQSGMLDVDLWAETQLPESMAAEMFPLNAVDLTIRADYVDNQLVGNITFHLLAGVPELDIVVYFSGNKTTLQLNGHVNVTYGDYFGTEINSTTLEGMLYQLNNTVPGPTGLVANLTGGLLECTSLETTKTEWPSELGADVQYDASIHWNFTLFFARLLTQMFFGGGPNEEVVYAAFESVFSSVENASLTLNYYHESGIVEVMLDLTCDVKALWSKALELVPPTFPPEYGTQVEAWLKIQNASAYAIQDFSLNITYSSTEQRLDADAYVLSNATQLENELMLILPDAVPPELRPIYEAYLSVTYCNLTYSETTLNYIKGTAQFEANWICEGDFKAQLNHVKRFYIDYLNATSPWMLEWSLRLLNETEIDISNFSADVKLTSDEMQLTFSGAIIKPPKDEVNPIIFKLYKFFNTTSYDPLEPPREFEKLKIIIMAGFNETHTILLYAPGTVPTPDNTSLDFKSMTWQNATLSSLKDLNFRVAYQEIIDYLGEKYYVPIFTNSTVSNFNFNPSAKGISFNVTGERGTGFCEITIPRALLNASRQDWIVRLDGQVLNLDENYTVTENAEYVFISLNYTHSSHHIEVEGTWIVPEFQPNLLPPVLIALSLIAVAIAISQRKKLGIIKTRYQKVIYAFLSRIH
ncbi:MAG: hypothetical protein ACUVUF_02890 [Candidatus Bathycorpusculaceae bacterium]